MSLVGHHDRRLKDKPSAVFVNAMAKDHIPRLQEPVQARHNGDGVAIYFRQLGHIRAIVFAGLGGVKADSAARSMGFAGLRRAAGGLLQK